MANMNNQELRQGMNKIEVVGVIKESKLNRGSNSKGNYINGSFIVKSGEFSEVEVNVFVNEKNAKGDIKKVYQTLEAIMDKQYKTIADGVSEEEATKVRRSEEHTSELQSRQYLVCRLLLEKK